MATALLITANGIAASIASGSCERQHQVEQQREGPRASPGIRAAWMRARVTMSPVRSRRDLEVERALEHDQDQPERADHGHHRIDPAQVQAQRVEDLPQHQPGDDQQHDAGQLQAPPDDVERVREQQQSRRGEDRGVGHRANCAGKPRARRRGTAARATASGSCRRREAAQAAAGQRAGGARAAARSARTTACRRSSCNSRIVRSMPTLAASP